VNLKERKGKLCHPDCGDLPKEPWYPVRVRATEGIVGRFLEGDFKIPVSKTHITKNMTYCLYQLEYIDECLIQQKLGGLLKTLVWKSGVVSSVSFVEAVLFCLVRRHGLVKMERWKKNYGSETLESEWAEGETIFRKYTYKAKRLFGLEPREMNLSAMIDVAFKNNLLPEAFVKDDLDVLRDLRKMTYLYF
jgi:hypothetical protein